MNKSHYEEKNFSLEIILTIISGVNFCNNFNDIFEIFHFVFSDYFITNYGLLKLKPELKKHLFSLYPELDTIKIYDHTDEWINKQKERFGSTLPITKIGQKLQEKIKTK